MPDLANPSPISRTLDLDPVDNAAATTDGLLPHGKGRGGSVRASVAAKEIGAAVSRKGEKSLEDYVKEWGMRRREVVGSASADGAGRSASSLPFLIGAKRMAQCRICHHFLSREEGLHCIVRGCRGTYHSICVKEKLGITTFKSFKCPQHVCFLCKQRPHWRCVLCSLASHHNCAAWPDKVVHLKNHPGQAVCWKHLKHDASTSCMEEIFRRLPLPFDKEEFKFDITLKDVENKLEPPAYIHIRRNIYLVKKKRDHFDDGVGCSNCSSMCSENCVCRVQCVSCSKSCRCPENCMNRPFRKERKIKVVKTELCGWGVEAAESINKGEFVIEYIGEVISDALCEQRLWDMKFRGLRNFYMCEVRKDFTIDATFKGNFSRFLNHSCDPNCFLEKWQVEGETRVGVFAARLIKVGEPLTYDYRFVQFGPEVECHCGATNCQGYLGSRKKVVKLDIHWGSKRKRTSAARIAAITL